MLRSLALLALALLAMACGEVNTDSPDAAATPDAPLDSAEPDPDAAPAAVHHRYVVDRLVVPRTSATPLRLDMDGDGDAENRLAAVLELFAQQAGRDLDYLRQAAVDRGIDRGQVILLADVVAVDLASSTEAELRTLEGATPVPAPRAGDVCRGHLAGGATFTIAPASPASSRVAGSIEDNRLVGAGGALVLKVPTSASRTVTFSLASARVELGAVTETGIQAGIVGGALLLGDFLAEAMPVVQESIQADVVASCTSTTPPCSCADGSIGATWLLFFDTAPRDCQVSEAEIRDNPTVANLLAPDLDVAPVDGTVDSLSVAFGITAVPASWPDAP